MPQQRLLPPRLQPKLAVVPKTPAPAAAPSIEATASTGEHWLYGIEAIQAFLELPSPQHVYRIKARAGAPIGKIPGIGMAATEEGLTAWRAAHLPSSKRSA